MSNFALRRIEAVKGRQKFAELLIEGIGQLESFENALQTKYAASMDSIYQIMNDVANLKSLPNDKFKDITESSDDPIREYEFKRGDLRVYAIKGENGKIIVLGGYKNRQDKDLRQFRSLKAQFIEHRKKIKSDEEKRGFTEK